MALFPCAVGSHRYAGRQQAVYLVAVCGEEAAHSRLRLCNLHFQDWRQYLEANMHLAAIGEISQLDFDEIQDVCGWCDNPYEGDQAFATAYPNGEEPRQYWTGLCPAHARDFKAKAQIGV